jgi:hypothetical protein
MVILSCLKMSQFPKLIYLFAFGVLTLFIAKILMSSSNEPVTVSGSLEKVIHFLEDTETFENEVEHFTNDIA